MVVCVVDSPVVLVVVDAMALERLEKVPSVLKDVLWSLILANLEGVYVQVVDADIPDGDESTDDIPICETFVAIEAPD
jgi:hypothetical protein